MLRPSDPLRSSLGPAKEGSDDHLGKSANITRQYTHTIECGSRNQRVKSHSVACRCSQVDIERKSFLGGGEAFITCDIYFDLMPRSLSGGGSREEKIIAQVLVSL